MTSTTPGPNPFNPLEASLPTTTCEPSATSAATQKIPTSGMAMVPALDDLPSTPEGSVTSAAKVKAKGKANTKAKAKPRSVENKSSVSLVPSELDHDDLTPVNIKKSSIMTNRVMVLKALHEHSISAKYYKGNYNTYIFIPLQILVSVDF